MKLVLEEGDCLILYPAWETVGNQVVPPGTYDVCTKRVCFLGNPIDAIAFLLATIVSPVICDGCNERPDFFIFFSLRPRIKKGAGRKYWFLPAPTGLK